MRLVEHQMQPCPTSCVSASLAMVAGLPAQVVVDRFHAAYHNFELSLRDMLEELCVPFKSFDTCNKNTLDEVGAYLCSVPSLNMVASGHQLVIEVTEDDYFILDPNTGREGRKFYVKRGEAAELGVELGGYNIDAFVPAEWLAKRGV